MISTTFPAILMAIAVVITLVILQWFYRMEPLSQTRVRICR
jgi:hypothetical protein